MSLFIDQWQKNLTVGTVWLLIGLLSITMSGRTIAYPRETTSSNKQVDYLPFDFSGEGRPMQRSDAGSSGPCAPTGDGFLTALVPRLDTQGITVDANPTLWFYVPFQTGDFHSMHLVLRNTARQEISTSPLIASNMPSNALPGVIGIQIPTPLEVEKKYDGTFTVYCQDPQIGIGQYFSVEVSVTRIEMQPELISELEVATTPEAKAIAYAKHGAWFDALTELGEARQSASDTTSLANAWTDLLEDIDLGDLGSEPVVRCCTN